MSLDASPQKESLTSSTTQPESLSGPSLRSCLLACILSSSLGALFLIAATPVFQLTYTKELGISPSAEEIRKYKDAVYLYWVSNYCLDFAVLGTILGFCVGLLTSASGRLKSAVVGSIAGASFGAITAFLASGYLVESILSNADQSLVFAVALNGSVWGGLFGAIAFAVSMTRTSFLSSINGLLAGVLSGFIGAIAYLVVFSFAFPKADLTHLVPTASLEKVIWLLIFTPILAVGLYFAAKDLAVKKSNTTAKS